MKGYSTSSRTKIGKKQHCYNEHSRIMYLQPRIDSKTTGCWVHARDVLRVVDVFDGQFMSIVPMQVIDVLPDQSMWLDSEVFVHLNSKHGTGKTA